MSKLFYLVAGALVVAIALFVLWPRCKEPSPLDVAMQQLKCAQSLDIPSLRAKLCKQQHGTEECQLDESDRPAGDAMFFKAVDDCAKEELQKQNKCIDKYEGLQ